MVMRGRALGLLLVVLPMLAACATGSSAAVPPAAPASSHPASAAADAPVEFLYAARSQVITLVTSNGSTGTLTLAAPVDILRFTDRPIHQSAKVTPAVALGDFGWRANGDSLGGGALAPNAALALTGAPTEALEIRSASIGTDGSLTLTVTPLGGRLVPASGPGSLFIDSTSGSVQTALSPNASMLVTYSGGGIVVQWQVAGITYAKVSQTGTQSMAVLTSFDTGNQSAILKAGAMVNFVSDGRGTVTFTGTILDSGRTYDVEGAVVGTYAQAS